MARQIFCNIIWLVIWIEHTNSNGNQILSVQCNDTVKYYPNITIQQMYYDYSTNVILPFKKFDHYSIMLSSNHHNDSPKYIYINFCATPKNTYLKTIINDKNVQYSSCSSIINGTNPRFGIQPCNYECNHPQIYWPFPLQYNDTIQLIVMPEDNFEWWYQVGLLIEPNYDWYYEFNVTCLDEYIYRHPACHLNTENNTYYCICDGYEGKASCPEMYLVCMENYNCIIECNGYQACFQTTFVWPKNGTGELKCKGGQACKYAVFPLPNDYENMEIVCDSQEECYMSTITCPRYANCTIICSGVSSCTESTIYWSDQFVKSELICDGTNTCAATSKPPKYYTFNFNETYDLSSLNIINNSIKISNDMTIGFFIKFEQVSNDS
eukprot:5297_1